jgi:hypothetical protein
VASAFFRHGLLAGMGLALLATPGPAPAWGHRAHAAIDTAAIAGLAPDGPAFLGDYARYVAASATLPDEWRNASVPFSKMEEDPNHGWFRERFAFLKPVPRSRYAFLLAVYREHVRLRASDPEAARHMNVRGTGLLAYAVMEQYGHLVVDMRQLRSAQAAGDGNLVRFMEQNCAATIVRLGHYVGDGSQPLHDTIHADGWVGPDPEGYTRDHKIHARFEVDYVEAMGLTPRDVRDHMSAPDRLDGDLFDAVLAFLDRAGDRMELVYQLDKRGAFADPGDRQARDLVYRQTGAGASMLRDLIARAWRESAGTGNNQKSLGPSNALYDPETGSAPAPD